MSPPQQTSFTVAAPTLPSSSSAHASPPVTTAPSFSMSVVPILPSPATEAEQKLPTPVTETVTSSPSVEIPDALPFFVAPVSGSVSTEAPVIEVEQKLTPITSTPAPVTASPVPKGSTSSAMAVNFDTMMRLSMLMIAAETLLHHVVNYLPEATSTEIMDTILFSSVLSLMFFMLSFCTSASLVILTLCGIHQNDNVSRSFMMLWAVDFLFGFCFLFTECYLMSIAAAA